MSIKCYWMPSKILKEDKKPNHGDIANVWFKNRYDGHTYLFQKIFYNNQWILTSAHETFPEEEAIKITVKEIENE